MKCSHARMALRTAEATELCGDGEGALAGHLKECSSCRDQALSILRQTGLLRDALATTRDRIREPVMTRTRRRHLTVAALSIAAGLIAVAAVELRRSSRAPSSEVIIENAQGRRVTVLPGRDTLNIVFWNRGTE